MPKIVFDITATLVKVKGRRQGHRSSSRSWVKVKGHGHISGTHRSILGARLCRV